MGSLDKKKWGHVPRMRADPPSLDWDSQIEKVWKEIGLQFLHDIHLRAWTSRHPDSCLPLVTGRHYCWEMISSAYWRAWSFVCRAPQLRHIPIRSFDLWQDEQITYFESISSSVAANRLALSLCLSMTSLLWFIIRCYQRTSCYLTNDMVPDNDVEPRVNLLKEVLVRWFGIKDWYDSAFQFIS